MDIYDAIRITGRGDINNMTVYKSGVKSSIRPDHLDTRNGASRPDYTSTSSGDVGYNPGSRYDDLTASRDRTYSGGRYDDVKVTADGRVTLKNMTIYGNLTIDKDVENGDVYLDDLDIRGHVYIYGGGENTVSFEDCEIGGNIYAKKDHGSRPVGLKIDSNTAEDLDGYISIEDNGAILENGGKLDKVYVLTKSKVEIDTDVKNLYVNAKTDNLTITSGTTVDKLSISSSSTITNKGTINELNTSQDITVNGNGTINNPTGNGTVTPGGGQKISVKGVSLNKTATTIEVGRTEKLTATVQPTNATNQKVTWSSSNTDVATVGTDGTVTAKAVGTADITVTTADGSKTAKCTVTVKEAQAETEPATGVTLNQDTLTLTVGGADGTLTATVTPEDTTDELKWTVSDNSENISITENNDGSVTVKALKATEENKTVTIVATAGSVSDTCTVTVNPKTVNVTEVTLDKTELELEEGTTATLIATVKPENATDKTVTWTIGGTNSGAVTLNTTTGNEVTVTAANAGTATITATAGGKEATCTVTVTAKTVAVESVTITGTGVENKKATMTAGEELELTATVEPINATNKTITWSITSDPNEAVTLKSNGNTATVKALEAGTATITATATGGTNIKDTITITVNPKALESITLTTTKNTLTSVNDNTTITASANPEGAELGEVTWSSTDTNVATVSSTENGKATVTAVSSGTAKIQATSGTATGECTITVNIPVTGVTIKDSSGNTSAKMTLGEGTTTTLQLTATVTPAEANYDKNQISWNVTSGAEYVTISTPATGETITVNAVSAGSATITAKVDENHSATFQITVQVPATPGTGEGNRNQPGETTTQATNNAIVVSR